MIDLSNFLKFLLFFFQGNDAVIACMTNGDQVKVQPGYNVADGKNNVMPGRGLEGISNVRGSVRDLVLTCSFDVEPEFTSGDTRSSHTFNLSGLSYHLLLATGTLRNPSKLIMSVSILLFPMLAKKLALFIPN
jgi:hypothetical protein